MPIKKGRVATKLLGREAGKLCAIVERIDRNFVLVMGPEVKKRRCNLKHLELRDKILKLKKDATDEDIVSELTKLQSQ
ncbi:MAG: 50S ribosomal protein L14e [Candidatus Methanofastidiosia archaeon]